MNVLLINTRAILGYMKHHIQQNLSSLMNMIKNVLKRRKECGTYLATACRHRWRVKMTMKNATADEGRSAG